VRNRMKGKNGENLRRVRYRKQACRTREGKKGEVWAERSKEKRFSEGLSSLTKRILNRVIGQEEERKEGKKRDTTRKKPRGRLLLLVS